MVRETRLRQEARPHVRVVCRQPQHVAAHGEGRGGAATGEEGSREQRPSAAHTTSAQRDSTHVSLADRHMNTLIREAERAGRACADARRSDCSRLSSPHLCSGTCRDCILRPLVQIRHGCHASEFAATVAARRAQETTTPDRGEILSARTGPQSVLATSTTRASSTSRLGTKPHNRHKRTQSSRVLKGAGWLTPLLPAPDAADYACPHPGVPPCRILPLSPLRIRRTRSRSTLRRKPLGVSVLQRSFAVSTPWSTRCRMRPPRAS